MLESYLFECQCALFLVDITSNESFEIIENLIETIEHILANYKDNKKNPSKYIKKLLILNKIDLDSEKKVSQDIINSFLEKHPDINLLEISLKTEKGIPELLNKILLSYENIGENNLPTDNIYEEIESYKNPQNCANLKAEATINCIIIGESEVGKSCFLMRYFRNVFNDNFLTTVGIDKEARIIKIKDTVYRITLWDTAGQERFRSLPNKYYQNADGVLLLFDVSKKSSFENVDIWLDDTKINIKNDSKTKIFLIGNKIDLKRVVTKEEAIKKANECGMEYFEVSCKINMNVTEVMSTMIYNCYQNIEKTEGGAKLDRRKIKKRKGGGGCCGGGNSKK